MARLNYGSFPSRRTWRLTHGGTERGKHRKTQRRGQVESSRRRRERSGHWGVSLSQSQTQKSSLLQPPKPISKSAAEAKAAHLSRLSTDTASALIPKKINISLVKIRQLFFILGGGAKPSKRNSHPKVVSDKPMVGISSGAPTLRR